jgi:hypothetical protein
MDPLVWRAADGSAGRSSRLDLRVNVVARGPAGTVDNVIETPASSPPPPAPTEPVPPSPPGRGMSRGQANLIRAFCLWTVWVWGTRIWNIWGDETRDAGFKAVHTVLAVISVAFAVAVWLVVRRLRTRATALPGRGGSR